MSLKTNTSNVWSILFDAIVPPRYDAIRPHHVVVWFGLFHHLGSTSKIARQWYKSILEFVIPLLSDITDQFIPLIHAGYVPDFLIRLGIRLRLRDHLLELSTCEVESEMDSKQQIISELHTKPIAIETVAANKQHYEVPTAFYDMCLGPCKKYSSGYWPTETTTFEESELHMLQMYCDRAEVQDGMHIVDLGCGWGSLTLYLIERYPNCVVTAISNSQSQREYIYRTAAARNLFMQNLTVLTCNVADDKGALEIVKDNDLVMTVEMFEHMKNYNDLLAKVHSFLKPGIGKLFVHIFTHKDYCYNFDKGWMSDNFFTGGTMPSDDLLLYFANDFIIEHHWRVSGIHYSKTSNAWLHQLDINWENGTLAPVLRDSYGVGKEREWYVNWRLFFLACAELWGLDHGQEYIVSHYLFRARN